MAEWLQQSMHAARAEQIEAGRHGHCGLPDLQRAYPCMLPHARCQKLKRNKITVVCFARDALASFTHLPPTCSSPNVHQVIFAFQFCLLGWMRVPAAQSHTCNGRTGRRIKNASNSGLTIRAHGIAKKLAAANSCRSPGVCCCARSGCVCSVCACVYADTIAHGVPMAREHGTKHAHCTFSF